MHINDLSNHISTNEVQIRNAVNRVIKSGWFILGPEVKQFETSFAEYIGINHCIGVANGTDAIEIALRTTGVVSGDLIATVANAGMYTTTAIMAIGCTPFFLDVDITTRNVTLAEVMRAVAGGVKAVVATHLYGLAISEILEISNFCSQNNIPFLEDCAQAHGARIHNRCVGSFGNAACFSFYPTKNLGALGDGGAVVTNNPDIAAKLLRLRQYGWTEKYKVEFSGARNSRLDEIQAALLSLFLPLLDKANERRREIAAQYNKYINHLNIMTPTYRGDEFVAHLYVVRCSQRESLRSHLSALSIASEVHYPIPDYCQPIFGQSFAHLKLSNTERLSKEILTLPCYPGMTDSQIEQVITAVNSWRP